MIIAKRIEEDNQISYQTLLGHTIDSLKILKSYLNKNERVLKNYCFNWKLDFSQLVNSTYASVFLHDIGKLCKEFQNNIKKGKKSTQYPHALYSFHLLRELDFSTILETPIERLAILGHHTQLHTEIYGDLATKNIPTFLKNEITNFVSDSKTHYHQLGFPELANYNEIGGANVSKYNDFETRKELKKYKSGQFEEPKIKLKSIYSLILSILQTCDDYSSAHFNSYIQTHPCNENIHDDVLGNPELYTPSLEFNDIQEKILGIHKPYKFQKEVFEECPKYSTIFAPCGRGKTEAALLWGLRALDKYNKNKIIFALPTQVTSNAMWKRLCKIFGNGKDHEDRFRNGKRLVGLFHGKSFLKQKKETSKEENIDPSDENFKGNIFFKPITITTIDHLMYSAVHGFSQADFAFGNLQNAVIIFDEAHYYEKQTLEHLTAFYRLLTRLNIPHLLMSGTLPKFLTNKINEFNEYKQFIDNEGLNNSPFKIKNMNEKIIENEEVNSGVITEIIKNFNEGEDVFVLLNTVERSKKVYDEIIGSMPKTKSDKVILYHSRFTHNHRLEKEKKIMQHDKSDDPFILVATQVIEISLDISSDKMYSEIPPPDAIGQRGGRLNRNGENWKNEKDHLLNLYLPENYLPYNEELFKKTVENLSEFVGISTYETIKKYCDKVYVNYDLNSKTNLYGTVDNYFEKGILFGPKYFNISNPDESGRALQLRDEKIRKIDVIPESIYNQYGEEGLKIENQVQIPDYKMKQYQNYFLDIEKDYEIYIICKMNYTFEKGFEWKNNESNLSNII